MQTCVYDFCRRPRNTTYQHDREAGEADLDYAMARYYASRSGRFMTPDPGHIGANVADPQSWNAYVYAGNDPINFSDPSGLCHLENGVLTEDEGAPCGPATVITVTPDDDGPGQPLGLGPCFDVEFARDCIPAGLPTSTGPSITDIVDVIGSGLKRVVEMAPPIVQRIACVAGYTAGGALAGGAAGGVLGGGAGAVIGGVATSPTGPGAALGAGGGALAGAAIGADAGLQAGAIVGGIYGLATCSTPPTNFFAKGNGNGNGNQDNMTADQIISKFKKSDIRQVFPGEYLNKTLAQIRAEAAEGKRAAQTALKLLTNNRFNK